LEVLKKYGGRLDWRNVRYLILKKPGHHQIRNKILGLLAEVSNKEIPRAFKKYVP
jgi:hypothetical protein